MSFEYFIGSRYLKTKKKEAFISLITILSIAGVTVGVTALIIVIAVMSGATSDFKSRILGLEYHILLSSSTGPFSGYRETIQEVSMMDGVTSASPLINTQAMLRSSRGVSGAVIRGIDPESASQEINTLDGKPLRRKLRKEPDGAADRVPGIILGSGLARTLGVLPGDRVYLVSFRGMISPVGHMPSMDPFRVIAEFTSGLHDYDGGMAYIHIEDAQKMLRLGDQVTRIGIRINEIYDAGTIAEKMKADLGYPYWTSDWIERNRPIFAALKLEKVAMFIILALIVLVAAFNIASALIMMVMSKTRDIAILKAMGASDGSVLKIFVFNGMVIGSIGTFLGICLGSVSCVLLKKYKFVKLPEVYPFSHLPVQLEAPDVFFIALAALLICFLATLYPAYQASKLDPVEAIRYG